MFNKFKTFLKLLLLALVSVLVVEAIFIDYIIPTDGIFYIAKRTYEKTVLTLKFDPSKKADYYGYLLEKRLKELIQVLDQGSDRDVMHASLRYYTTVGDLTDLVVANKLSFKIPNLKKQLLKHREILSKIITEYRKEGSIELRWVQDDINYLDLTLNRL